MNTSIESHPAAKIFPLSTGAEFAELVASIRARGFDPAHPILLFQGLILDGRNRYRAALAAKVEPVFAQWVGRNPYRFAWQENAIRRHLEPGTKAACYVEYLTKSDAWEVEQAARIATANGARSAAAQAQPRADGGLFATGRLPPGKSPEPNHRHVQHADAAGTGASTLARAFALHSARPDIHSQVVTGEITLREALRLKRRDEVHKKLAVLPSDKFRVVYADPPWSYAHPREGCGAAEDHYPSMSLQQICAIDVASICWPDAVLFLWTTSPLLPQGLEVMNAWGFEYKACFVWDKVTQNFGFYNSVRHEFLLIGTRGSCLPEVPDLIDSVQSIQRSKQHSEKPAAFRAIIDRLYPSGARLEMFVRGELPPGWVGWGAEVNAPGATTACGGK